MANDGNSFEYPTITDEQMEKIERTAQGILDARALYPELSFDELYDETKMPPELRKAHQENDRAVMEAYGIPEDASVEEIIAHMRRFRSFGSIEGWKPKGCPSRTRRLGATQQDD